MTYGTNVQQVFAAIRHINAPQKEVLKTIANDILEGLIPISDEQVKTLSRYKTLIRRLGKSKTAVSVYPLYIEKNIIGIRKLLEIALPKYEISEQISSSSNGQMGKGEGKISRNNNIRHDRSAATSSSEEDLWDEYNHGKEEEENTESEEDYESGNGTGDEEY